MCSVLKTSVYGGSAPPPYGQSVHLLMDGSVGLDHVAGDVRHPFPCLLLRA
jgi:hypothetical protein